MYGFFHSAVLILFFKCVICFSLRKDQSIINQNAFGASYDDCDPSSIPVMHSFDMKKFSGKWFELAKTVTGYIDVADGVWLIEGNNASHNFLFSGRDNNQHCIRPIKGKLSTAQEPPGMLTLRYTTYSTHVEENVRVLFTDYSSVDFILFLTYLRINNKEDRLQKNQKERRRKMKMGVSCLQSVKMNRLIL
nr:uncharacterized protein LOC122269641 [Parasteatoda tepidariorum]